MARIFQFLALFKTCPTGFFPFRLEQRTKPRAKMIKIRPFGPLSPPTSFSSPPFRSLSFFILFFSTTDNCFRQFVIFLFNWSAQYHFLFLNFSTFESYIRDMFVGICEQVSYKKKQINNKCRRFVRKLSGGKGSHTGRNVLTNT